jgi:hypothetical protein
MAKYERFSIMDRSKNHIAVPQPVCDAFLICIQAELYSIDKIYPVFPPCIYRFPYYLKIPQGPGLKVKPFGRHALKLGYVSVKGNP